MTSDFLHKNLLYEEFLYRKFKSLVFSQMRRTELRNELKKIVVDFVKSEFALTVFTSQFNAALRNQQVIETFVDGCRGKAFEIMDTDQYKTMASKKLRNIDFI